MKIYFLSTSRTRCLHDDVLGLSLALPVAMAFFMSTMSTSSSLLLCSLLVLGLADIALRSLLPWGAGGWLEAEMRVTRTEMSVYETLTYLAED